MYSIVFVDMLLPLMKGKVTLAFVKKNSSDIVHFSHNYLLKSFSLRISGGGANSHTTKLSQFIYDGVLYKLNQPNAGVM